MVQAAEPRHRYDPAIYARILARFTTGRRSLREREMRSIVVVVMDVLAHQSFQMPLIDDDHVVEQITTTTANPTFSHTVLPRASESGPLWLNPEALHCVIHCFIKVCAAVEDQVARRGVVGESFAYC